MPRSKNNGSNLGPVVEKRIVVGMRIPPDQLEEIKARASKARLTFTEYMIRCALGEPVHPDVIAERLDELEERLAALERMSELGALG